MNQQPPDQTSIPSEMPAAAATTPVRQGAPSGAVPPTNPPPTGGVTGAPGGTAADAGQLSTSSAVSCACQCATGPKPLVYALGRLAYDFASTSRKESLQQSMGSGTLVENPDQLLAHLEKSLWDAAAVQWILLVENAPVYVIEPQGAFARNAYDVLRHFLRDQLTEKVERVSIPGTITGSTQLRSGVAVATVNPEIRGMFSWTTDALIKGVMEAKKSETSAGERIADGVRGFLDRVYYELRNFGQDSRERAINYAATNAFQIERVYESAMRQEMELDTIEVEPNPLARPSSETWDVKLSFFFPDGAPNAARKIFRLTVDVTDVVPVTVGEVRSWSAR